MKVEQVLGCTIWRYASICIWGDIAPKSEKIAEKWQYIFRKLYFAILPIKSTQNDKITKQPPKRGWKARWEEKAKPSRVYAQRAPSNSDVDFLLSQVSHLEGKWERKTIFFWKKEGAKSVFFSVVSSIFRGWKRWNVKTRTKTNHNPLYYRGLRRSVWHLWQQKHKNSCIYARMLARERRGLQVFSHNSTPRFSYLDFGHLFCLLWLQIALWKDTRRLQKMTACFQQNNVSFSIKQRVIFNKTTYRFL